MIDGNQGSISSNCQLEFAGSSAHAPQKPTKTLNELSLIIDFLLGKNFKQNKNPNEVAVRKETQKILDEINARIDHMLQSTDLTGYDTAGLKSTYKIAYFGTKKIDEGIIPSISSEITKIKLYLLTELSSNENLNIIAKLKKDYEFFAHIKTRLINELEQLWYAASCWLTNQRDHRKPSKKNCELHQRIKEIIVKIRTDTTMEEHVKRKKLQNIIFILTNLKSIFEQASSTLKHSAFKDLMDKDLDGIKTLQECLDAYDGIYHLKKIKFHSIDNITLRRALCAIQTREKTIKKSYPNKISCIFHKFVLPTVKQLLSLIYLFSLIAYLAMLLVATFCPPLAATLSIPITVSFVLSTISMLMLVVPAVFVFVKSVLTKLWYKIQYHRPLTDWEAMKIFLLIGSITGLAILTILSPLVLHLLCVLPYLHVVKDCLINLLEIIKKSIATLFWLKTAWQTISNVMSIVQSNKDFIFYIRSQIKNIKILIEGKEGGITKIEELSHVKLKDLYALFQPRLYKSYPNLQRRVDGLSWEVKRLLFHLSEDSEINQKLLNKGVKNLFKASVAEAEQTILADIKNQHSSADKYEIAANNVLEEIIKLAKCYKKYLEKSHVQSCPNFAKKMYGKIKELVNEKLSKLTILKTSYSDILAKMRGPGELSIEMKTMRKLNDPGGNESKITNAYLTQKTATSSGHRLEVTQNSHS